MKFFYRFLSIAILSAIFFAGCHREGYIVSPEQTGGDYIVVLKMNGDIQSTIPMQEKIENFIKSHNISMDKVIYIYDSVLNGFAATLTQDQANMLSNDPNVKFMEKDHEMHLAEPIVGNIDYKAKMSILTQTASWGVSAVGGSVQCSTITRKAWIVDTGIDLDHSDLNVNTTLSKTYVRSGQDARSADDGNGHGSHVAGIIAAKDNQIGALGIAAGAPVVAVKVLNRNGSGLVTDIVAGLNYVFQNKSAGDVVNLSLGGGASTTLDNAVAQFGTYNSNNTNAMVFVTLAAGNENQYAGNTSPARTNGIGIYTVSAYGKNNNNTYYWASWSNYGYDNPVDVCAPGVNIYSCYKNGGYATLSGTSMAAPQVAGILLAYGGLTTLGTVTDSQGVSEPKAYKP